MILNIEYPYLDGQGDDPDMDNMIKSLPYKMVGFGFDIISTEGSNNFVAFYDEDDEYFQLSTIIRLDIFINICKDVLKTIKKYPYDKKHEKIIELIFPFTSYSNFWFEDVEKIILKFLKDYDK